VTDSKRAGEKMRVAILAGGLGTRLAEETEVRPKPMVEVGGKPILWHIMKIYAHYGFNEFVVALGYKGDVIKRFMVDYSSLAGDMTVHLGQGQVRTSGPGESEDWTVKLIETGLYTQTGGRIKRLAPHLGDGPFMLTWGDGVADIDIDKLIEFHRAHGKAVTVTAVRPPARFGALELEGDRIVEFSEKPQVSEGWINGAFFVCEQAVFDYIDGDDTHFEKGPLEKLAKDGQLMAYRHSSYWQCMDTIREKQLLNVLWDNDSAPWKIWK
jgi:glucose-1-phosphate cytidylyltransferase